MAEKKVPTSVGTTTSSATPTTNGSDSAAFSTAMENKLLGQSAIVSSFDTNIEQSYADATAGIKAGNEASKKRLESVYSREKQGILDAGENSVSSFAEGRSGFATQMAGLRNIVQTTDKNLNDLTQRKEELILQGDANAANAISGLIIDRLKFKQQAEQQVFANLLGMANYGAQKEQSAAQLAQSKYQFDQRLKYDETSAMSNIALKYGLQVNPGEDLTSLYSRATSEMGADSPAALAIKQAKSEIDRNNADILRIKNEIAKSNEANKSLSDADLEILANAAASNPSTLGGLLAGIKDPTTQAKIISLVGEKGYTAQIENAKNQDVSKQDLKDQYIADKNLSAPEKSAALAAVDKIYGPDKASAPGSKVTISTVGGAVEEGLAGFGKSILDFFEVKNQGEFGRRLLDR